MSLSLLIFATAVVTQPVVDECQPIPGWHELLEETSPQFIVVGEMHGNRESPQLFADAVCLTTQEQPVIVALEFSQIEQGAINAYLASDGGEMARQAFLSAPMWQTSFKDGRSSEAMFALFERLRHLKRAGRVTGVVAFIPMEFSPEPDDSERSRAQVIQAAAENEAIVLVYTGNVHAMQKPVPWRGGYLPMAGHLPAEKTVTLDLVGNGGDTWACSGEPIVCGPMQSGRTTKDWRRGVVMHGENMDSPFGGAIHLGVPTTASPPAVAD